MKPSFHRWEKVATRCANSQRKAVTRVAAFTLVEVTLALGLLVFAFVALLGMVPVGFNSFQQSKSLGVSSQIAEQIFSEVQTTTFANLTANATGTTVRLPAPNSTTVYTRYFDEQGLELNPPGTGNANAQTTGTPIYLVNTRVLIATPVIQSTGTTTNTALATVTVQVAYDPSGQTPDSGTATTPNDTTNFWTGTVGNGANKIQIYNYEMLVSKNS